MPTNDDTFLARWSRRKTEARGSGPRAGLAETTPSEASAPRSEPVAKEQPADEREPVLTEADFADVDWDALGPGSDFSRFLGKNVPEGIRGKALSRMWASDPVLSAPDPFFDYAGDYTDKAVASAVVASAYKFGQGFLSDEEAKAWEDLGKPQPQVAEGQSPEVASGSHPDGGTVAGNTAVGEASGAKAGRGVSIAEEPPDQPEVIVLLAASDALMVRLYPAESNHLLDVEALVAPGVRFLVARREGRAIGCGALVPSDAGAMEVKRMFVAEAARGTGAGRALLCALEALASSLGASVVRLETGVHQQEAIALYRASGYADRGPFGTYRADPLSLFMEKRLG